MRRHPKIIVLSVVLATSLIACSTPGGSEGSSTHTIGTEVAHLEIQGSDGRWVSVHLPEGVAPEGTDLVSRALEEDAISPEVDLEYGSLSLVGTPISLELAEGQQPQTTVTIANHVPVNRMPDNALPGSYFALSRGGSGELDAFEIKESWDRSGGRNNEGDTNLSFSTAHFTDFSLYSVNPVEWMKKAISSTLDTLNQRAKRPDCVGKSVSYRGASYSISMPKKVSNGRFEGSDLDIIYPCVSLDGGGRPTVLLTANTADGWRVASSLRPLRSQWEEFESTRTIANSVAQALGRGDFLLPGGSLRLYYGSTGFPRSVGVLIDPGPLLSLALASSIGEILEIAGGAASTAWKVALSNSSCITGSMDALTENTTVSWLTSHLNCFSGVLNDVVEEQTQGDILKKGKWLPAIVVLNTLLTGLQSINGFARGIWSQLPGSLKEAQMIVTKAGGPAPRTTRRQAPPMGNDIPMDRSIAQTWGRKGVSLNLIPDWTGTLTINSGAANQAVYRITWQSPDGFNNVRVSVGEMISTMGDTSGLPTPIPGNTITGTKGSNERLTLSGLQYTDGSEFTSELCYGADLANTGCE